MCSKSIFVKVRLSVRLFGHNWSCFCCIYNSNYFKMHTFSPIVKCLPVRLLKTCNKPHLDAHLPYKFIFRLFYYFFINTNFYNNFYMPNYFLQFINVCMSLFRVYDYLSLTFMVTRLFLYSSWLCFRISVYSIYD